jgi:glycogen debranching enzyme
LSHPDCHYFIEDYAMQFIEAVRMYYDSTADAAFLAEVWPTVVRQLQWFEAHMSPSGLLLARECENPTAFPPHLFFYI